MTKELKIALYCLLAIAIIAVVWLMFGNTNPDVEIDTDTETTTEEEITDTWDTTTYNNTDTFEEDVMKDLEWFFGNNNGYEDVEWEYWFTSTEAE